MVWVNTSPLVKTYTLEEFWALPEPPDHSKLELIAGVLYMTALDIKELWLVDETSETIEFRNQTAKAFEAGVVFTKDEKLNSLVLPDLSLTVSQVFES